VLLGPCSFVPVYVAFSLPVSALFHPPSVVVASTGQQDRASIMFVLPSFQAPGGGAPRGEVVLRLVSDSYLGLDQTFRVALGKSVPSGGSHGGGAVDGDAA